MEQTEKNPAEIALHMACHDIVKMESHSFMTPIDPTRADRLFNEYLNQAVHKAEAAK